MRRASGPASPREAVDAAAREVITEAGYGEHVHPPHRPRHRPARRTRTRTSSPATPSSLEPGMAFSRRAGHLPARAARRPHRGHRRVRRRRRRAAQPHRRASWWCSDGEHGGAAAAERRGTRPARADAGRSPTPSSRPRSPCRARRYVPPRDAAHAGRGRVCSALPYDEELRRRRPAVRGLPAGARGDLARAGSRSASAVSVHTLACFPLATYGTDAAAGRPGCPTCSAASCSARTACPSRSRAPTPRR